MEDMKITERSIHPSMRISQVDTGSLEIESMAFVGDYPESHIRFCYEIQIRKAADKDSGWDYIIFKGTLKELIDLVNTKGEVK